MGRRGIFATGLEPEPRTAVIRAEKLPSCSASGCAAGGQTTGPGKRAVVSHVQTGSGDRSSPRVPRGNCAAPVNDRDDGTKKLEDYLPSRPRRKTPTKLSESPILSPDTTKALENAERLVKEAQKRIIEASYDIDSSPEREKSIGSAREREAEDEDALYIRDIVSTRFHEANESARIFTRPSARPLAERLCRPEVRRGRARRLGEGANKTRGEQSTIRRSNPLRSTSRTIEKNFNATRLNSFRPQRAAQAEETPNQTLKPSMTSVYRSAGNVSDQTSANPLKVQQGPRVDIRNELTVTDVENLDISPKPRSSLPVRNIKTYEFRHESCVKDVVAEASRESDRSTERETGVSGPTRRSPEVAEESADPIRSGAGAGPARQGSRSDLVGNKSGRSIRPEPLEGRADSARTSKRDATEHRENPPESFIDFLRRAAKDETGNLREDAPKAEALRSKVLGSLNTEDKIDIFDRAIDAFFEEFKRGEASKKNSPRSLPGRDEEVRLAERDVVDGDRVDDEKLEDFAEETLGAVGDEPEVFGLDWNPEEIKLEPPNLEDLERTVRRFDSTIEEILLGTRNLEVLMSRYCVEAEAPERPEVALTDPETPSNNPLCTAPATEIPDREQQKTAHVRTKKGPRCDDRKSPISEDDFTGSSEESGGIRITKSGCKASREAKLGWREKRISTKLAESRPRFSTPLNDGSRIIASSRGANADFETEDFGGFFIGIERPKCGLQRRRISVDESEVSSAARRNGQEENSSRRKKIVLDRIDRNCDFDKLFDRDRPSGLENEENSHETATFPTYTAREKRVSSDARNSGRSLVQDSAIGRTTDQSEKIFLGTKLIDERVARKDSSRSERSAPMRKNYESPARSSPSTKTLTVKNRSVNVEVGEIESKKLTDDGTKKQRSKGEETSDKNRLAGSAGSSPRDRTSLDVSNVYSDDFEEPVVSSGKSKSEEKIASRMIRGENSVSEEKKSSAIVDGGGKVEEGKSSLKESGENFESTKSDRQNSIFNGKKSAAMTYDRNREVEDGKSLLKESGENFESTKSDRQNSIFNGKKSAAMTDDRNREVEDGKSLLKEIGEKNESTKSDRQNSVFKEKKSSAMTDDRNREVEDGKNLLKEIGEKNQSTKSDRQNSVFKEKKSSAMTDDRNREVEDGKSVLKEIGENFELTKSDRQNSIFNEKKSSAMTDDRNREVEDRKSVLKEIGEKLESTKSDRQNSIFNGKKSSAMTDDRNGEVEDGKSVLKEIGEKLESTKSDRQNSIFIEKKSSIMTDDRNREVEDGKSSLKEIGEKNESTKCDRQHSVFIEKKSSATMNDRDGEVEDVEKSGQNSIANEKKSSAIMDDRDREVEDGETVLKKTIAKPELTNDRQNSIFKEKKSSALVEVKNCKTVRSPQKSPEWPRPRGESREETKYPEKSFSVSVNESSDRNKDDDERRLSQVEGSVENNSLKKEAGPDSGEVSEKSSGYRASVLSSSGSIKASGTSSLLRESHREGIKGPEESKGVEAPEDCVLGKKPIACSRLLCEGSIGRYNCEECTNCPVLETIEVLKESTSIDAVEKVTDHSLHHNEEEEIERPELETPESKRLDKAFSEFREICPFETEEDSTKRFEEHSPSNFESLKENTQDWQKEEEKKGPEKVDMGKLSRIDKVVGLENEANTSSRIFCEDSDRSSLEFCTNYEKIGGFESSAIIHSTPKQFIGNSGRTVESLVLPFPDPIPDDDHIERAADACSENYSEGELYLPSSCSYSLGEIRISERPSYGTVGTGVESSTRNSDGIRIFFTKSYSTIGSSDHTINAPNTAIQSPGEVQETDVESIGSSRGLSSSGEHRRGS